MRKELLEKFIKENFNLEKFNVNWLDDFIVELIDSNNDKISFMSIDGVTIDCNINDVYFNSYTLDKDLFKNELWFVFNRRKESERHE